MRYISKAFVSPSKGLDFSKEKELTLPGQAITLHELLRRFVRGEALAVGMKADYGDENLPYDLEKIAKSDLVDRHAFIAEQKEKRSRFDAEEKARLKAEQEKKALADKKAEEKRVRIMARKLAKQSAKSIP